jgi:hypothetical protein
VDEVLVACGKLAAQQLYEAFDDFWLALHVLLLLTV